MIVNCLKAARSVVWVSTLVYVMVLLYFVYTDVRERRISNRIVLTAAGIALLEAIVTGTWLNDLLGGLIGAALFVVPRYLYGPEKAGDGDVKLALFLGLWLGYPSVLSAILIACLCIALLFSVSVARGVFDRNTTVPMAPFFAIGTFSTLLWNSI